MYFDRHFLVDVAEPMPMRPVKGITDAPHLWRYFVTPDPHKLDDAEVTPEDYVVHAVMKIKPASTARSWPRGKNMGAFEGVGYPEDIGHYYPLESTGHTWIGHNRFPTNTPGWWEARTPSPFSTGRSSTTAISPLRIDTRYLEQFGYGARWAPTPRSPRTCSISCSAPQAAARARVQGTRGPAVERDRPHAGRRARCHDLAARGVRTRHAQRPLRDRARLQRRHGRAQRPHQAPSARGRPQGRDVVVASEESAIREVLDEPDECGRPKAGEPVIARVQGMDWPIHGDLHLVRQEVSCAVTGDGPARPSR